MNAGAAMSGDSSPREHTEVDVVVLGVGTCGEDVSLRLLGAGLQVVGIEASLVGGECAYWACLPTKLMIRAANLLQEARRVEGASGRSEVTADWELLAKRVRSEVTGGWDDSGGVARYESRGGRLIHGRGRLTGPRTVAVGDLSFTARRGVVIATGSVPSIPPIPGLSEVDYWTTHDVISAERLPRSLVVLGGGAVGCELAQIVRRFGGEVTVVEAAEHLLPGEEPEASELLEAAFAAEGISVHSGKKAEKVEKRDGSFVVKLSGGEEVTAERLLVATGRKVDLSDLGLESAGLDPSAPFLEVDERMRVADGIWAMGDVTAKGMFSHVALYQSALVAAEILGEERSPARYDAVPRATFTDPEVASVGLTESEARAQGIPVVAVTKQLGATFRGWLHGGSGGVMKLVADRESGHLVGATAAGPHGGEMLGFLSLAVHSKIPLRELQHMIYAFPTFYGSIGEMIGAYGRGLSTVMDPGYEGFRELDEAGGRPGGGA
jgi:pyruvate/2-oxoglutarate dehydrogenase complex dihydrolipoamide dehydrogenase (E3) component